MDLSPILIIGSTGKTGRRVANRLKELGQDVREGSRRSTIPFDWDRPETWAPALRGVRAAYITYFPDLAVPQAPQQITDLVQLARDEGLEHLVLLSGRGEPNAKRCEEIVLQSGLPATVVRTSWFAQNFDEGHFLGPVLSGTLALPVTDRKEPFIDADDIADVVVAALTDSAKHAGELYELTGPRLLSFGEAADEIRRASGRDVKHVPVTFDHFHDALEKEAGAELAGMLTELIREVLDGRNAWLGDGVQRALGREPRDFRDYCEGVAARGGWETPTEALA